MGMFSSFRSPLFDEDSGAGGGGASVATAPPPALPSNTTIKQDLDAFIANATANANAPASPPSGVPPTQSVPPTQTSAPPSTTPQPPVSPPRQTEAGADPSRPSQTAQPEGTPPVQEISLPDPDTFDFDGTSPDAPEQPSAAPAQPSQEPIEADPEGEAWGRGELDSISAISDEDFNAQIDSDPALAKRVQKAFLATSRGKRILTSFKALRDLESSSDEGGIGFIPSKDQIRDYYTTAQAHLRFSRDLAELPNTPERINDILGYVLGDDPQKPSPSASYLAANIPAHLARHNPQAFQALRSTFLNGMVADLKYRAENTRDPNEKRFNEQLATAIQYHQDPNSVSSQIPSSQSPQQPQRNRQEEAEVQRLREENLRYRNEFTKAQEQRFTAHQSAFLDQADETVLGLLRQMYGEFEKGVGPQIVRPYLQNRAAQVRQTLLADPFLAEELDGMLVQSFRNGSIENGALKLFKERAQPVIRRIGKQINEDLKELSVTRREQATQDDETRRRLAQGQQHPNPNGSGQPVPAISVDGRGLPQQNQGESSAAYNTRVLKSFSTIAV